MSIAPKEQPIAREKTEHNFDEGIGRRPIPPWRRRIGRYGRGLARFATKWRPPRFSRGLEQRPETPSKRAKRRFSQGMEQSSHQE
jgi:hypothetical protein